MRYVIADIESTGLGPDRQMIELALISYENGRITDVDIASESANLARLNILQQAGTAMLAQANQSNQSILRLLM